MLHRLRPYLLTLAAAALLLGSIVASQAAQLAGLGSRYWSRQVTVSTSACITDGTVDGGSSVCTLFPAGQRREQWYNVTILEATQGIGAGVTCCMTLTSTGATVSGSSQGIITDPLRGAGGAGCYTLDAASDREQFRPWATDIRVGPGGRAGICAGSVTSGKDRLYPPCSNTSISTNAAECTAQGLSGTAAGCIAEANWTQDQRDYAGAYLVCVSASGSQPITVSKERIQER
ncbi:hypothetical protein EBZ39_17205 [bacterium]|nr:hypothetical protein [bacterium]